MLAALPGFLVLAMLLARVRVTVVRLVAVLAAAVVAVGTVAVLDWMRPPADRSHLGRFVEQVLTGEAWTVISRKGQANLDILLRSPLAWMLPVAIVAAVWLVRPGGLLRSRRRGAGAAGAGGLSAEQVFVVRSVLLSALLSLVLGAAVNDSGVAAAGDGRGPARAADGLAGRRGGPRGYRFGGDGGWRSPLRAGRGRRACYGRLPWIDRLEHVIAAFFTTPSRRSTSSSPAELCPLSARD